MFAKIENNQVVEWPIQNITQKFPYTSFPVPITQDSLPEGYVIVLNSIPPEVSKIQKVLPSVPILQNEVWVQGWTVLELTQEELEELVSIKASDVRANRNYLLDESDWSQVADAPVNKAVWAAYRQGLRDVTSQSTFPWEVTWPTKPE